MIPSEAEVYAASPLQDVFEFLANAENDARWCPSVLEVKSIDKTENRVKYQYKAKPGPRVVRGESEIISYLLDKVIN